MYSNINIKNRLGLDENMSEGQLGTELKKNLLDDDQTYLDRRTISINIVPTNCKVVIKIAVAFGTCCISSYNPDVSKCKLSIREVVSEHSRRPGCFIDN